MRHDGEFSQDLVSVDQPKVVVPDRQVRVLLAQDLLTNDDGLLGQLLSLVKLALQRSDVKNSNTLSSSLGLSSTRSTAQVRCQQLKYAPP